MDRKQWRYEFGERLYRARNAKGMTQAELAKELHASPGNLGEYERGLHEPTAYVLGKIARALDVSADELLGVVE